jgi:hypothetical protein
VTVVTLRATVVLVVMMIVFGRVRVFVRMRVDSVALAVLGFSLP